MLMVAGIQEPPKTIWAVAIAFGCLLELEGQTLFLCKLLKSGTGVSAVFRTMEKAGKGEC